MVRRQQKRLVGLCFLFLSVFTIQAADHDQWTEAARGDEWNQWKVRWETLKDDWTQVSISPGRDETELNFAWYRRIEVEGIPMVKISESNEMRDPCLYPGTTSQAVSGYHSNKVTVTQLEPNKTYYYSYGQGDEWSDPIQIQTRDHQTFSYIVTADPQIGASSQNIDSDDGITLGQEKATRNDAFNWNHTLNQALKISQNAAFLLNVGDQVQTRYKEEEFLFTENEIEYVGFLSPPILKSLPVATVIGNHDSPSGNYSFHFNNPNATNEGKTMAGADYYFSYGDALFIVLNSNSDDVKAHEKLMQEAIKSHPHSNWRFVALHHDIYGSGEHSNDPVITEMRYELVPLFEKYEVDVVLTGHDHVYSRSKFLKGALKDGSSFLTSSEYKDYLVGKIEPDERYKRYLNSIADETAIVKTDEVKSGVILNPKGIVYYTLNSASGSKYYQKIEPQQAYIQARWQENVPTFMVIEVQEKAIMIQTYRSDTLELIDEGLMIQKDQK